MMTGGFSSPAQRHTDREGDTPHVLLTAPRGNYMGHAGLTTEPGVSTLISRIVPLLTVGSVETHTSHVGSPKGGTACLLPSCSDWERKIHNRVGCCDLSRIHVGSSAVWEAEMESA